MFAVACVLTGAINHLMGLEVSHLLPLVVLECGCGFGCMAAILGGLVLRDGRGLRRAALLLAVAPGVGPAGLRAVFAVGLFIPGWKYSRR